MKLVFCGLFLGIIFFEYSSILRACNEETLEQLAVELQNAATVYADHHARRHLAIACTPAVLEELLGSPDDSVAVFAALQIFRMGRENNMGGGESADWLLGFLCGRTGSMPPDWWKDWFRRRLIGEVTTGKNWEETVARFQSVAAIPVKKVADQIIIVSISVDEEFVIDLGKQSVPHPVLFASQAVSPDYVAISLYREHSDCGTLLYLDRKTKDIVWKTPVLADWILPEGPSTHHYIGLQIVGESVLVFGGSMTSVYLEVFDRSTGSRTARFTCSDL